MNTETLLKYVNTPCTLQQNRDGGYSEAEGWDLEHVSGDTFKIGKFQFTSDEVTGSRTSPSSCLIKVIPNQ